MTSCKVTQLDGSWIRGECKLCNVNATPDQEGSFRAAPLHLGKVHSVSVAGAFLQDPVDGYEHAVVRADCLMEAIEDDLTQPTWCTDIVTWSP
jgi:hypothetical protein